MFRRVCSLLTSPTRRRPESDHANNNKPKDSAKDNTADLRLLELQLTDCNLQDQSPLFSTIPAEIRNQIFGLALSENDGKDAIPTEKYWYRPDYTHDRYIDTALLRTCRRVYLETRDLPQQNVTCRFWIGSVERAAPLRSIQSRAMQSSSSAPSPRNIDQENGDTVVESELPYGWENSDDMHYRKRLNHMANIPRFCPDNVQLFPQLFALEGEPMRKFMRDLSLYLRPKRLTITIRYTDWWHWEKNFPLRFYNTAWMENFQVPSCVEELVTEFETRNGKRAEMDSLVRDQASRWRFEVGDSVKSNDVERACGEDVDGEITDEEDPHSFEKSVAKEEKVFLVPVDAAPKSSTWVGAAKLDGTWRAHHSQEANDTKDLKEDEMLYYITTMVWRREKPTKSKK
ncbi:hypothetical protein EJ08DRAFT_680633 [Tothia fuscella]|uniref:Uncharacterized protein n=1 Tax=Tothia fuscella TaxID=1048955 RepID=A0A9P4NNF8_9PEZI|nr:hypothetical protein EJ08DRAFT_680633 [Tothia fuscella]